MASRQNNTDPGRQFHDLFREVFKLHAALSAVMNSVHEQAGLSTAQHKVIRTLQEMGPVTVPDMAAQLGVSRQFVQTVCNRLSAMELLQFEENPRHKRSRLAILTDKGRTGFQQARRNENHTIAKALTGMDAAKAAEAHDLLKRIRRAVQNHQNQCI
jgi:DNA-binding MarR family transcriptional regulator